MLLALRQEFFKKGNGFILVIVDNDIFLCHSCLRRNPSLPVLCLLLSINHMFNIKVCLIPRTSLRTYLAVRVVH